MLKKILIIISLIFAFARPTYAIDGFITITNPNGGTFTEGDTVNITWNSSPNIDTVNIGYKSCPSCLGWVVFSTPNTGSYSWKVDVGNTTNTQFYLQITGYESGKGSLTSNSGTFTVNQNPPLSTGSSSTAPSPTPTTTSASSSTSSPYPAGYNPPSAPTPTPTPRPITQTISIYNLIIYQDFYFEGSLTTNLKNITDPKNVENFTLDTQKGFTFVFEESLNLTDQKTLAALQNTKNYWEYEAWFIWIEWEWWIKYDMTETISVEYRNDALTAYVPEIIADPIPTPTPIKSKSSPIPRKSPSILGAETGKVKIAVNDGTPVRIKPKVQFSPYKSPVSNSTINLTGYTSHTNLSWTINHNGVKSNINPEINKDTGEFEIKVSNLVQGANTFVLSYAEPGSDPVSLDPITILYKPSFLSLYWRQIVYIIIAGILSSLLALTAIRYFSKINKLTSSKTRKAKKSSSQKRRSR